MGNPHAIHLKARSVLRALGHSEGEIVREYADWHLELHSGLNYVTVWWSGCLVFMSMAGIPVHYRSGPWEQYLDRLFHKLEH